MIYIDTIVIIPVFISNNKQMKNRQFIILCILVIVGFSILYIQQLKDNEVLLRVERNIDQNVANMDWYYRDKIQDFEYMQEEANDMIYSIYSNL